MSRRPSLLLTKAQLREDYVDRQLTMRAIAEKWNVSLGAVHYSIAKHGIRRRQPGRPRNLKPADRKSILRMRKVGYGILWIADMLGVNRNHVWRTLKAEGLVGSRIRPAQYGRSHEYPDAEPMVG